MAAATAILKKNVISEWGKLLYGAAGKADTFYKLVIKHLEEAGVPGILVEYEDVGAKKGLFGGTKGEIRRYLTISSSEFPLVKHRIGAEDFGTCLSISRYLSSRDVELAGRLMDPDTMSIFESEKLVIYNTVAQNAVVEAVRDIMNELGQDSSDIDTKSKGYLDVW